MGGLPSNCCPISGFRADRRKVYSPYAYDAVTTYKVRNSFVQKNNLIADERTKSPDQRLLSKAHESKYEQRKKNGFDSKHENWAPTNHRKSFQRGLHAQRSYGHYQETT
ncbi:hypothetical protein SAMN05216586_10937 [Halopseudomonas aestusnigri]|uniref:Uncharacterized protein n=1 Tax=Halopseudomonas aestusnigri TaxID=857252 RepID=A0AAQ1G8Y2_9GAMM|nr:hypothetical protein SAMN05216586_10937 [Halopseudomonas aestusnigri]